MEKYSKAVSEMYSQFKQREAHPAEKYVGRYVQFKGQKLEVIGYSKDSLWGDGCFFDSRRCVSRWVGLDGVKRPERRGI